MGEQEACQAGRQSCLSRRSLGSLKGELVCLFSVFARSQERLDNLESISIKYIPVPTETPTGRFLLLSPRHMNQR